MYMLKNHHIDNKLSYMSGYNCQSVGMKKA